MKNYCVEEGIKMMAHTFVLITVLIGAGESTTSATYATLEQCVTAGQLFIRSVPSNMGHRATYSCQQSDGEPVAIDETDEMAQTKYSEGVW